MIAVLFLLLTFLLVTTVPIFIALSGSVAISFALFTDLDLVIVLQRMFAGVNKFSLMSIPLFILAANLMGEGGISKRIINASYLSEQVPNVKHLNGYYQSVLLIYINSKE